MNEVYAFAGIAGATLVGAMSPGPSFIMVARTSVGLSRQDGLFAAMGMGLGALVFASLALGGLHAVLLAAPGLYAFLRIFGGLYLLYLAVLIWSGSKRPIEMDELAERGNGNGRSLMLAFLTQISNPKTAIAYASVFAAFLPTAPSMLLGFGILVSVLVIETCWYALVAIGLSTRAPRAFYLRCKTVFDRLAAGVLGGLGGMLVVDAIRK